MVLLKTDFEGSSAWEIKDAKKNVIFFEGLLKDAVESKCTLKQKQEIFRELIKWQLTLSRLSS